MGKTFPVNRMDRTKNRGLRGITVADTKISFVDGERGKLYYRGYAIQDFAENASFEEVVHLLLARRFPSVEQLAEIRAEMARARELPEPVMDTLRARPRSARPMDVLQGTIACLADHDPDLGTFDRQDLVRSSLRLISRLASVLTAWFQLREGREPVSLPTNVSHAEAFLTGLWGRKPTPEERHLVDTLMVLHAEHTFNASTFAAREVASTRAHAYNAVAAAIGSLSGELHGSANARVMETLFAVEETENVTQWVRARLESGERVMGLGHAVYRVEDPRAKLLKEIADEVLAGRPEHKWFQLAEEVAETGHRMLFEMKGKKLYPNVDLYSGPILYSLGLPTDFFPAFFAVSRAAGWCAHVIEEQLAEAQPRPAIYRPRSHYVGRLCGPEGCRFVPLEAREAGETLWCECEAADDRPPKLGRHAEGEKVRHALAGEDAPQEMEAQ
jgi:citrate synthase